jgi:5-methylcytosine-specific restriction endonuclease McrA
MAKTDGRAGHKWRQIRAQVLATNTICWLCGLPGADSVDHVIPLSVAPELAHDPANLKPAHRRCNSKKGAKVGGSGVRHPVSRAW